MQWLMHIPHNMYKISGKESTLSSIPVCVWWNDFDSLVDHFDRVDRSLGEIDDGKHSINHISPVLYMR